MSDRTKHIRYWKNRDISVLRLLLGRFKHLCPGFDGEIDPIDIKLIEHAEKVIKRMEKKK